MTDEFTLKAFGAKINMGGRPEWYVIVAMLLGLAILAYLVVALILYATIQLYPWIEFTWGNVFWFLIVLLAAKYVFGKSD